jgi:hypothetical protein
VRIVRTTGDIMLLSMALDHVPPSESTIELRWPIPPRGRCCQKAKVISTDGNRAEVRFLGKPSMLQARRYVRGGGGEPIVLVREEHDDVPGVVHDMSERAVRAHFTGVEVRPGEEMLLRIRVGEQQVEFPATALKVNSMRQQVPKKGPLSVEMVAVFEDDDEDQAVIIRRYIMRHQMEERNRGLTA